MPGAFVAIVGSREPEVPAQVRSALLAAGASAVLSWPELAAATEPDDTPAVLLDLTAGPLTAGSLASDSPDTDLPEVAELTAALSALAQVDGVLDSVAGSAGAVIVTTRLVTDTLKRVDAAGTLIGTAERDEHRFVGAPIAARLRVLRSVPEAGPDPVAILTALADRGVTVTGIAG